MFELRGLDPEARYVVRAGAPGWLARERVLGVQPGGAEVVLKLEPLYGFRLLLQEADGAPLRGDVSWSGGSMYPLLERALENVSDQWDDLALSMPTPTSAPTMHERPFVYVGEVVADRAGPILFDIQVPGFQPSTARVWAPRLDASALETVTIELTPSSEGFGRLRVEFDGLPAHLEGHGGNLGSLSLTALDHRVMELGVSAGGIYSIPRGRYGWRFSTHGKLHTFPEFGDERVVEIESERVAEVRIPMQDLTTVEVRLMNADGTHHEGFAILRVARSEPESRRLKHVRFTSAPYRLHGIPAGAHRLSAITGTTFSSPGFEDYVGDVELVAGQCIEVVLSERL